MSKKWKEWKLKALTPIFTGDASRRGERTILTGIMGSLRWWFEVLVRGLGGKACDPTTKEVRCPQDSSKKPTDPGHHCVVCELFGYTGWARKFRLMVVDKDGKTIQNQIKEDDSDDGSNIFILRFIPLHPIAPEEWCLLDATLRLIANYGALGGKTVFKPSDEWGIADLDADDLDDASGQVKVRHSRQGLPLQRDDVIEEVGGVVIVTLSDLKRILSGKPHGEPLKIKVRRDNKTREINAWAGKRHHQDFGLITVKEWPQDIKCALQRVKAYVQQERWRKNFNDQDFAWASLRNFWFVEGRYLGRESKTISTFNVVVGRKQDKSIKETRGRRVIRWSDLLDDSRDEVSRWLAGSQQESKKVFSFKHPEEARRTFGFVKLGLVDFDEIKRRLRQVWQNFNPDNDFMTGEQIMEELFKQEENS